MTKETENGRRTTHMAGDNPRTKLRQELWRALARIVELFDEAPGLTQHAGAAEAVAGKKCCASGHRTGLEAERCQTILYYEDRRAMVERHLLGAILIDGRNFDRTRGLLRPHNFKDHRNREIFRAMLGIPDDAEINLLTVKLAMDAGGVLRSAGGATYLAWLVDDIPDQTPIEQWAKEISR